MKKSVSEYKRRNIIQHRETEATKAIDKVYELLKLPNVSPDTTYRVLTKSKERQDKLRVAKHR